MLVDEIYIRLVAVGSIQHWYATEIDVADLPAGTYDVRVIEDRTNGLGWVLVSDDN